MNTEKHINLYLTINKLRGLNLTTKQKKVVWIILGIIIFVFSVFLGLGYLGQITGGNSLIQRTEINDKYVPAEITKYYPIEDLNSKESLLSLALIYRNHQNTGK